MGEYTPGLPLDMDAVDEVAQTATAGGDKAEQTLGDMQEGFLKAHEEGRFSHFAQGTGEGRANGRGLRALLEAIPAV
ncbi:hypothetical protein [Streptomyces sp. SAS_270]|uniref:hypothetical protein n=1 Tax=Streptomyces sp. SAS_270 TaxID=3412748 RepID=UPI00403C7767